PTGTRLPNAPDVECLGAPDLIVLAEGGKSATARRLGLEKLCFSYPKYFMSAHIDHAFGPRTRRIDREVSCGRGTKEVSLWAIGHGDPGQGTWIIQEVPWELRDHTAGHYLEYFSEGAALLLDCSRASLGQKLDHLVQDTQNGRALAIASIERRIRAKCTS